MTLESEFRTFIVAAFHGQPVSQVQIEAMRDAFFAGAMAGHRMEYLALLTECEEYVRKSQPTGPDKN